MKNGNAPHVLLFLFLLLLLPWAAWLPARVALGETRLFIWGALAGHLAGAAFGFRHGRREPRRQRRAGRCLAAAVFVCILLPLLAGRIVPPLTALVWRAAGEKSTWPVTLATLLGGAAAAFPAAWLLGAAWPQPRLLPRRQPRLVAGDDGVASADDAISPLPAIGGGLLLGLSLPAWARIMAVWTDGSPFGTGTALALLALGGGAGFAIEEACGRARRPPLRRACRCLALLALCTLLAPRLLHFTGRLWLGQVPPAAPMTAFLLWQTAGVAAVILPAAIVAGICLAALCVTLPARHDGAPTARRASGGRALALGIAAAATSPVAAGGLIPGCGVEATLRAGAAVAAIAAAAGAWTLARQEGARRGRFWRRLAAAAPLLVLPPTVLLPPVDPPLLSQAPAARRLRLGVVTARMPGTMRHHADGAVTAVSLRETAGGEMLLCRDGQVWASSAGDLPGRLLAVHLPLLLHPAPRRIALLGLDCGLGAAAAVAHQPAMIDCAECETALPSAARLFLGAGDRARALQDARLRLTDCPPATLLAARRGFYDVIVSPPLFAWRPEGAAALTRAHFTRCRASLAGDGIVCVALDAAVWTPAAFREVVADFRHVFPHVQVWCPQVNRYLLIGSCRPLVVPADRLLERFDRRTVFRDLARAGVRALPDLLACHVLDDDGVSRYLAAPRPWQTRASARFLQSACARLSPRGQATAVLAEIEKERDDGLGWLTPGALGEQLREALVERARRQLRARAAMAAVRLAAWRGAPADALARAREAAAMNPGDAFLERMLQAMEQEAAIHLRRGDFAGAARRYADILGIVPERPAALYGAAMADRALGRAESAWLHLVRAVAAAPEEPLFRLALAEVLWEQGREEEAIRQYRLLAERAPDNAEAWHGLAIALSRARPPLRDTAAAIRAAEEAARLTGYRDRRIVTTLADLYIDAGRVIEGVGLKRRLRQALPRRQGAL